MSTTGGIPRPRTPRRPVVAQDYSSVTLEPAERRSLAMTQMCLQAAIWGVFSALLGLLALFAPGHRGSFFLYGGLAALTLYAAWAGSKCEPIGKTLLLIYSGIMVLLIPIGTIQGIFQILHLSRPEANLVFSGRDRFSPAEAADIRIFGESNPNLTAWIRIVNGLTLIFLVLMLVSKLL